MPETDLVQAAQPYEDSTGLRDDAAGLRTRLDRDGYLFLRGVLPEVDLAMVRRSTFAVIERHGWVDSTGRPIEAAACWDPDPAFRSVHREAWTNEAFHALAHHRAMTALMAGLLAPHEVFVHPRACLRLAFTVPSQERVPSLHQDHPEIQGSLRTLTAWVPLARCGPTTGSLMVVPGSHRSGTLPLRLTTGPVGWETSVDSNQELRCGECEPGDVLIFTAFTLHGASSAGPEAALRLSIDARYQPVGDPISETCLDLVDEPFTWSDVYQGWMNRHLQYYWRALDLDIRAYDPRLDDWRSDEAIRRARDGDRAPEVLRGLELARRYDRRSDVRAAARRELR